MGKILDKIVQDDTAPSRNDLWLDGETLKANVRGKWKSISGRGSGAGVTIVDSIDKLDNNAPAGSLAVVAQQGTTDMKKPYDLYQLDVENDCLIDQENYTIEILYPEKLSKVKNVDFNMPSAAIHGGNPSTRPGMTDLA